MLPSVIDLFSGCGGLALGFEKAGFQIVAGIELMPEAVKTISYNLDYRYGRESTHLCEDITKVDGNIFNNRIGKEGCIIIGGPPCQAYSRAGKGKLRSLGKDRINTKDARGYLYQDLLKFVFAMEARAVVMENVPESVNYGDQNIPQHVCDILEKNGYKAFWTILNSADFGVPQIRERIFILGIKETENKRIMLPVPTHKNTYENTTIYQKRFERFKKYKNFKTPLNSAENDPEWVNVNQAIWDLPRLLIDEKSKYKLLPLNIEMPYFADEQNEYQKIMRSWYGRSNKTVTGNAFRNNSRDVPIFARMKQGDNYINAIEVANKLFENTVKLYSIDKYSEEYKKLKSKMIPKYDPEKFENKWKRLDGNRPSHTLMAHLCKDTYSHIHPWEPRGISVREAARLQSFPDDFFFNCSMGDAFKQIGNAVPPLLAYGVAKSIKSAFEEE